MSGHSVVTFATAAAFAALIAACACTPAAAQDAKAPAAPLPPASPASASPMPASSAPAPPAPTATQPPAGTQPPAAAQPPLPANRLTGIETNRMMIAAEAPTDIVVNGTPASNCALLIEFGDGSRSSHVVSESAPFPLKVAHTYPKMADVNVRVTGSTGGAVAACEGALDAAVHVSPAGSKIETITLAINTCPEGWSMVGQVNADKSFKCTPIPDASAPTNLIHCTDGMKYFARGGNVGCAHPVVAAAAETVAQAKAPMKVRVGKGGKSLIGPQRGGPLPRNEMSKAAATPDKKAAPKTAARADAKGAPPKAAKKAGPAKSATGSDSPN